MERLWTLGRAVYAVAAAAIPDFGLVLFYGALWIAPRVVGVKRIDDALLALALELIAVFAAGMLALTLGTAAWWTAPDVYSRRQGVISWIFSPAFYVTAILITTFLPRPALGLTPQVKIDAGLLSHDLWDTDPKRGLAAGMLYYSAQAFYRRATRLQSWLSH